MTRVGTNWSGWCVALLAAAVAGLVTAWKAGAAGALVVREEIYRERGGGDE